MRLMKIALAGAAVAALASVGARPILRGPRPVVATFFGGSGPPVLFVSPSVLPAALNPAVRDGSRAHPYATIADALRAAPDGAEVHLAAGDHVERLAIVRAVTLVGEGAGLTRIVSPSPTGSVIALLGAGRLGLRGLTVEGGEIGVDVEGARNVTLHDVALRNQRLTGLKARDAGLELDGCEIVDLQGGQTGTGVELHGGSLELRDSVFRRAGRRAVVVRASRATLTGIDVEGSSLSALQATDGSEVTVTGGRFAWNGGAALYAGGSKLRVVGARLENNEMGIVGFRGARLDVEAAQIYDHTVAGIALTGGSGRIRNSTLARGGSDAAIAVAECASLLLEDNTIFDPGNVGVHLSRTKATLHGNDIRGAHLDRQRDFGDGVYALESQLILTGNVLHGNAGSGLAMTRSKARLQRNDVLGNDRAGGLFFERSVIDADDNLFDGNKGPGVEVSERSVITLRRNRFGHSASPAIQDFCGDAGRRGKVELAEGNSFVAVPGLTRCL